MHAAKNEILSDEKADVTFIFLKNTNGKESEKYLKTFTLTGRSMDIKTTNRERIYFNL